MLSATIATMLWLQALSVGDVGTWDKVTWVLQVIAIPLLVAILLFVYDTWRKSIAVYAEVFGNPNKKDDRGHVGLLETHDREIGRLFEALDQPRHQV